MLPSDQWQEVAPLLTVLACLSVFRPITWVLSAFMEAEQKTNRLMFLEVAKVGILLAGIALLRPFGLRVAAGAVGIAFGATAIAGVVLVSREGPSVKKLVMGFVQPLLACCVMAAAVWVTHDLLVGAGVTHPAILLAAMIGVGMGAYVPAALILCRATTRDLLQLMKRALSKKTEAS